MTDDRLRDAAAAVFGYLDELAGDPRLAARVGLLRAWVEANLPGAEPSDDLRARIVAVLIDAGVYVAPGEATWERLLYRINREAAGHRVALAQAERAQRERDIWKTRAVWLLSRVACNTDDPRGMDDPRARDVDEHSWSADKALRAGDRASGQALYRRAAVCEEAIFMDALNAPMSTRSVIAVSAAALWLKAGEREKVDAIADLCLSLPDRFTPAACTELRDIKTKAQALP